jgi:hypothetical protein
MKHQTYGDAMRKETLKQARKLQRNRPRASSAFALANAMMLASNRVNGRHDTSGSYESANDRLLAANERSRS